MTYCECKCCNRIVHVYNSATRDNLICNNCSYNHAYSKHGIDKIYGSGTYNLIKPTLKTYGGRYLVFEVNDFLKEYYKTNTENIINRNKFLNVYLNSKQAKRKFKEHRKKKEKIMTYVEILLLKSEKSDININNDDYLRYIDVVCYERKYIDILLALEIYNYIINNHEKVTFIDRVIQGVLNKIESIDLGDDITTNRWKQYIKQNDYTLRKLTSRDNINYDTLKRVYNTVENAINYYFKEIYDRMLYAKKKEDKLGLRKLQLNSKLEILLPSYKDKQIAYGSSAYYNYISGYTNEDIDKVAQDIAKHVNYQNNYHEKLKKINDWIKINIPKDQLYQIPHHLKQNKDDKTAEEIINGLKTFLDNKKKTEVFNAKLAEYGIKKENDCYDKILKLLVDGKIKEDDILQTIDKFNRKNIINQYLDKYHKKDKNVIVLDKNYERYINGEIELDVFKHSITNITKDLITCNTCRLSFKLDDTIKIKEITLCIGCYNKYNSSDSDDDIITDDDLFV